MEATYSLQKVQKQDAFERQNFESWVVSFDVRFHVHADVELHHGEDTDGEDDVLDDDDPKVRKAGFEGPLAVYARGLGDELHNCHDDGNNKVEIYSDPFALPLVSIDVETHRHHNVPGTTGDYLQTQLPSLPS